jgi:myo-inositol-1(or 4)-monophosphatase
MHPFLTIADQAARLSGQRIMRALEKRDRLKTYEKPSYGLVTEIDYEVERLLIQYIHNAYPTHSILTEESGYLEREDKYLWILDPIDGTTNFIHGLPGFAISIAIQKNGILDQALVYDPWAQETFYASRGQNARLNQMRIRTSQRTQLKNGLFYLTRPPSEPNQRKSWLGLTDALLEKQASTRQLGSAALGLAYVAAGRLDGLLSYSPLNIWDIAAGALLVQEAGGQVFDIEGGEQYLKTGQIIASNPQLSRHLLQLSRCPT